MARTKATAYAAESFFPGAKSAEIDRDKGVVKGVRICGPDSKNGTKYPGDVLTRAIKWYDGVDVNVDLGFHQQHASNIPVTAKFGTLQNPRFEAEGVVADLHFNPKHPFAESFLWAAENSPSMYGFSHYAKVQCRNNPDGTRVAESILGVLRVDIVSEPATTHGLFESRSNDNMDMDPKAIAVQLASPDALTQFLTQLFDALPSGSFDMPAKQAVMEAMMAKFAPADVPADPMAAAESLKRYGKLGQWAAESIVNTVNEKAAAKRKADALKACVDAKLPAHLQTEAFVTVIAESIHDAAKVQALIDDRKAIAKPVQVAIGGTPTTGAPQRSNERVNVKDLLAGLVSGR